MKPLWFAAALLAASLAAAATNPYRKMAFETESIRQMGTLWQTPEGGLLLQACDYENHRSPLVFDADSLLAPILAAIDRKL